MIRAATPAEINREFERVRKALGRPMTADEIKALDYNLSRKIERGEFAAKPATEPK